MRLEADEQEVKSYGGCCCTLVMVFFVIVYGYIKFDVLMRNKDVDVLSVVYDKYFDHNFQFTAAEGLNVAVAFTAYDSETEWILDESYGELVMNSYSWGPNPDGTYTT